MYANEKQNGKFEHTKITATTILVEKNIEGNFTGKMIGFQEKETNPK